ncbi:hypothetical protein [Lysinibacter sp. HNR]|uniref:hypothetical protein n=1 Tax=Lysinibacter sp. HNR TaxID=3031408 RepID=UPI0024350A61|nr:hypothetical protein [Lysinibacter sp. HNR]WGD37490.1 hypothetical protein FrondiHNR_00780 [Lysinibacter sp. HNR]
MNRPAPSLWQRMFATWLVIFPLVAFGQWFLSVIAPEWPPVLLAAVLTATVVPLSVAFGVPLVLRAFARVKSTAGQGVRS